HGTARRPGPPPVATATTAARAGGTHASVPVHTSATVGKGTGSHGRTVRTAGSAVRGHLRHARTRHAPSVAAGQIQAGPGTATRTAAASADATVSVPAAHQTARPPIDGPA